jgi:hypothetical protein
MLKLHRRPDPVVSDSLVGVHHDGVALARVYFEPVDGLRDVVDTIDLVNEEFSPRIGSSGGGQIRTSIIVSEWPSIENLNPV